MASEGLQFDHPGYVEIAKLGDDALMKLALGSHSKLVP